MKFENLFIEVPVPNHKSEQSCTKCMWDRGINLTCVHLNIKGKTRASEPRSETSLAYSYEDCTHSLNFKFINIATHKIVSIIAVIRCSLGCNEM
jgi:hypothetical protein